jgi:two-component system OmpR family response regulator
MSARLAKIETLVWFYREIHYIPDKVKKYNTALIIDDDTDICLMLKSVLRNIISDVQFVQTLALGKEKLSSTKPDVIFLDNNLPDGQGINMVNEIKNNSPSSLVVFITAARASGTQAVQNGADAFLEKPLTYSSILETLEQTEAPNKEEAKV